MKTCALCLLPIEGGAPERRRYCRRPNCVRVRWIVYRLRRGMTLALRCRWCRLDALPGKTWCEYHQILKRPCASPDCQGPLLRTARGRQPDICDACDLKRRPGKRRGRPGDQSARTQ